MTPEIPLVARPASTVVLLREGRGGDPFDVYLTRRPEHFAFVGGFHVFPGGAQDDADRAEHALARIHGKSPDAAAAELEGVPNPEIALAHWMTAVREVFEEAGVLLAVHADGRDASADVAREALETSGRAFDSPESNLLEVLERNQLSIAADRIRYFSHWITPPGPPRRFDTRFFVARMPSGQEPAPHPTEVSEALWSSPRAALASWEAGGLSLMPPSVFTLQQLGAFASIDELFASSDLASDAESRGNARLVHRYAEP